MWCEMSEKQRQPAPPGSLPDFLKVCVQKGILDERSAQRIELYRRSRGLGKYETGSPLMNDPPDQGLTFENYVVCKGNSFAVELAKVVAYKSPLRLPYNPLYIYGDVGIGKTHLLSAIANAARDKEVMLVNAADLETERERAERLRCRAEMKEWLVSADILLVDDIQFCEGREDIQRDLFSVLNHMIRAQRWVVISSDVPPTQLTGVESRLLSRLRGGVIVGLQMGDKRERRNLIRLFLDNRPISEDIVDYLSDHVTDDVRRLKAAVAQIMTLHEESDVPLTVDMVQTIVPPPEGVPESTKAWEIASQDREDTDIRTSVDTSEEENRLEEMLAGVELKDRDVSATKLLKKMLAGAESKEEQCLALQIAVGERIRQLRNAKGDPKAVQQLEQSLNLLREGRMEEAIQCIGAW
jgi:DNA replication protein DnaC